MLKPVGNFKSYSWSTGATTPGIIILQPGKYLLSVTDSNNCTGIDSVLVSLANCKLGFMPTAFTPNGDGLNDLLRPLLGGTILKYQFMVVNRSGQIVFQTTDPAKGWDGKFKGALQSNDIYVWTCTYQLAGESIMNRKGTVALLR
jgi:gliding motility-associated-like protein